MQYDKFLFLVCGSQHHKNICPHQLISGRHTYFQSRSLYALGLYLIRAKFYSFSLDLLRHLLLLSHYLKEETMIPKIDLLIDCCF